MPGLSSTLSACGIRYERYRIFDFRPIPSSPEDARVVSLTIDRLKNASAPELRALMEYSGSEAIGFGLEVDGQLAAGCWYWYGERYKARGFLSLAPTGAKLVQLTTATAFRGRGIATALVSSSAASMARQGFDLLVARVWHSNTASCATFRKAGWRQSALITVFNVPLLSKPIRFTSRT